MPTYTLMSDIISVLNGELDRRVEAESSRTTSVALAGLWSRVPSLVRAAAAARTNSSRSERWFMVRNRSPSSVNADSWSLASTTSPPTARMHCCATSLV